MSKSFAFLTPTYGPDFDRCSLLVRSFERFVEGDAALHLIVDPPDVERFRGLESERVGVLEARRLLPWWLVQTPLTRKLWLSLRTPPVRGWIVQQLLKLSANRAVGADYFVFVDSDVCFVKPFDPSRLLDSGRLRLHRVPGAAQLDTHFRWHRAAGRLLGLGERDYFGADYIGNLITWRRDHLEALHERLEEVSGKHWRRALLSEPHLSEYILYGVFVDHVLGASSGHFTDDQELCLVSWDHRLGRNGERIDRFFAELRTEHVAVMVDAKLGLAPSLYANLALGEPV